MIRYEIQKTIRLRYVGYTIAALFLASAVWFAVSAFSGGSEGHFSAAAYRQMVTELRDSLAPGQDLSESGNSMQAVSEADDAEQSDLSQDDSGENASGQALQDLLAQVQEEKEQKSEDGYTGELYTNNITEELWLYRQVIAELEQVAGYEEYLDGVQASYERMKSVSLFADSGSDTPNARKTAADFAAMEDVEAEFVGGLGTELFLQTDFWTVSLVIAALILVAGLLLMEMEDHGVQLLHCTAKGKSAIIYTKYAAGAWILTGYLLLGAACRLLAVAMAYGTEGWDASIQSVYGAQSCTWKISILQAMLLLVGVKLLALLAVYSLLFLLALVLKKSTGFYLVSLGVLLVSYAAYQVIDANSFLCGLKWFNPAAFLYTDFLLLDYRNFTLFGVAISYWILMAAASLLVIVLCLLFAGRLFAGVTPTGRAVHVSLYAKIERAAGALTGGSTLFGFENRKWLFYQGGVLICIALLCCVIGFSPVVSERLYEKEEIYYKYYVKQVEGAYTQEKMDSLYDERARLEEIALLLQEEGSTYTDAAIWYYNQQLERGDGLELAISYGEYLAENGGSFVYEQGYEDLLGIEGSAGEGYLFAYRTAALAVMVLLAGLLWGIEQRTHMDRMLRISAFGTGRINRGKMRVVLLMGLFVAACVYVPWIVNVQGVFGLEQVLQSACSLELFAGIPVGITLLQVLILFYLLHVVYLWLVAMLLCPVERWTGNSLVAQLLVFAVGMVPILLV